MIRIGIFVAGFSIFIVWASQESYPINGTETNSTIGDTSTKRILTPKELEMANAARAHIAKVLERNLIRLFAAISVQPRQSRQEEDDGDDEDVQFNPNTLPQVAQLLGAIFSGNLNLTSVVDQAFYLVPQTVRNQVNGIFKLLGGQTTEPESSAEVPNKGPVTANTTRLKQTRPKLRATTSTETPPDVAAFMPSAVVQTTRKTIKNKPKWTAPVIPAVTTPEEDVNLQDDELNPVEQELVTKAKEYVPTAREKEPRFFINSLRQLFSSNNVNLTQVVRVMPDLFKGARQAFILLDELGVLPDDLFPGLDADDEDD